jgi:signal transduction histidine kinase
MEKLMINTYMELMEMENALRLARADKAVAEAKFEMVSDILHDIGNAVVGFGAYLTRIRRSLEQANPENLVNLAGFFSAHQEAIANAIGMAKAGAVAKILQGTVESQNANREEIQKSITEQLNIISHVQEILFIQRQYAAGQETDEKGPVNLQRIISECLSMLFASIEKRGITVSVNITSESPFVQGDRTKLMQVVLNLLKNSIEAIALNAVEKSISICMSTEEDTLKLELKDSGNGFDEAISALIFERGYTTKASGTGLGLHNCRVILECYSGNISISSDGPGKGALATIRFKI